MPPPSQCWIVGGAPTGACAGQGGTLAAWTDGGWRFVASVPGMAAWPPVAGVYARVDGTAWQTGTIVANGLLIGGVQVGTRHTAHGTRQAAIAAPAAGTTIDAEARATLGAVLAASRTHGLIAN